MSTSENFTMRGEPVAAVRVRVLDLTGIIMASFATQILAGLAAEGGIQAMLQSSAAAGSS